jgi:LPXTG-motif cell wall-anchored protein
MGSTMAGASASSAGSAQLAATGGTSGIAALLMGLAFIVAGGLAVAMRRRIA